MTFKDVRVFVRIALVLALLSSLALAACGGDGGDEDAAAQLRDAATTSQSNEQPVSNDSGALPDSGPVPVSGAPEQQVRTVVTQVQRAVGAGKAELVCDNITAAARRSAAERASAFDGSTCVDNFAAIAKKHVEGSKLPKVTKVAVDGDSATVTLLDPIQGKKFVLPVVKEGGAWRIELIDPGASEQPEASR